MDNGIYKHKVPTKAVALTRSSINKNFALAPNNLNGIRYSSIEASGSSGSSDISSGSSGCEIRTRNRNAIQRQAIDFVNYNEHNYRWTVNSIDKSTKNYDDKQGINISSTANDTNSKYSVANKEKWTHKIPINGSNSM